MHPEKLAASALLTLAALFAAAAASPRPADRYRNAPSAPDAAADHSFGEPIGRRRHGELERTKRGYTRWMVRGDHYQGFSSYPPWQPQVLGPAYIIPVYPSTPEKPPVYFHRKPFDVNPGFPPDNPIRTPYRAPPYLPPRRPTTTTTTTTSAPKIVNRMDGEDDDRPIWGGGSMDSSTPRPSAGGRIVPTRPPPPPNVNDVPPLVHIVDSHDRGVVVNHLSMDSMEEDDVLQRPSLAPPGVQPLTTTRRTTTTTTTISPTTQRPRPPQPSGPSNCVWAVVTCCSAASSDVSDNCFEQRGCPGPFWDSSPCDSDFARAAISSALNYYNQ